MAAPKRPTVVNIVIDLAMIGFAVWHLTETGSTIGVIGWSTILALGVLGLIYHAVYINPKMPVSAVDAQRSVADLEHAIYDQDHHYRPVRAGELDTYDAAFYDRLTRDLRGLGFEPVGDVISDSMNATGPLTAVIRVFTGEAGTTGAAVYHAKARGLVRVLQLVRVVPIIKTVEFGTELTNGIQTTTANTLNIDTTPPFPGIPKQQHPADTPVAQLLAAHRAHVAQVRAQYPDVPVVPVRTLADALACELRGQRIKRAHKQRHGYGNHPDLIAAVEKEGA